MLKDAVFPCIATGWALNHVKRPLSPAVTTEPAERHFLRGGGEMGALIRAHEWGATPIGPPTPWPESLRTAVGILLNSGYPMYLAWGDGFTQIYNEAYRPIRQGEGRRSQGREPDCTAAGPTNPKAKPARISKGAGQDYRHCTWQRLG